jgi:hypothetical protein
MNLKSKIFLSLLYNRFLKEEFLFITQQLFHEQIERKNRCLILYKHNIEDP